MVPLPCTFITFLLLPVILISVAKSFYADRQSPLDTEPGGCNKPVQAASYLIIIKQCFKITKFIILMN